ncbi:MAG: hypothetical protein ACI4XL_03220 [Bacillus sp. (in: firmicutes)]
MRLRYSIYVICILVGLVVFRILYQKQFGAVSFFLFSIYFFFLAYREWKKDPFVLGYDQDEE